MPENPVRWFEIYVQDMERAKAFYEGVFEVRFERIDMPGLEIWSFPMQMGQEGIGGALVKMPGAPSGGNSTIVYFACADCAVQEARAERLGGRIHKPKTPIGKYGCVSLVHDTEGNLIGLHSL